MTKLYYLSEKMRERINRKPDYYVRKKIENSLLRGLVMYFPMSRQIPTKDVINGAEIVFRGTTSLAVDHNEVVIDFPGTTGNDAYIDNDALIDPWADINHPATYGFELRVDARTGTDMVIDHTADSTFTGRHTWVEMINGPSDYKLRGGTSNSSPLTSKVLTFGEWYQFIWTYDGTNISLYIDGVLDQGPTSSGSPFAVSVPIQIMGNSANYQANGAMKNLFFYNRGLSAGECRRMFLSKYQFLERSDGANRVPFFVPDAGGGPVVLPSSFNIVQQLSRQTRFI